MVFQHRSQPHENASLQHQILEQTIEIFGDEAVETTMALNNYGCTLQALGKGEEGNSYLERCLAIRQRQLGTEHEESLITESNIWVLHLLNRDWKKAILIGEPLTDRIEQALGKGWVYLSQLMGLGLHWHHMDWPSMTLRLLIAPRHTGLKLSIFRSKLGCKNPSVPSLLSQTFAGFSLNAKMSVRLKPALARAKDRCFRRGQHLVNPNLLCAAANS